ncbi:hypothetical protein [Thalassotalea sp. ND16A]|uniref:hypothetical protein n=1 Tax=Thalassotalea sp. ND16A TaxID=1535422 RepID=UPI00051A3335|nr:hypothetical protein [Thalassotalea sp. ND16A]KGJ99085.1 hypothetical protein ND16A_0386 [Thalassotalea sp. ND16A]
MYKKALSLAVLLSFSNLSMATVHLCPVTPKVTDGCTFDDAGDKYGEFMESIIEVIASPYSGEFKPSCDAHDICYQTLGKTQAVCDHEFRENLYDECGVDPLCKVYADTFVESVQSYGIDHYNAGINISYSTATQAESNIITESCVTTPKYTDRYSSDMLNYVRSEFKSRVGRNPTTGEEFDLLNLYSLNENGSNSDYNNWTNSVTSHIQNNYLNTSGPEAIYYKQSETFRGWTIALKLHASLSKGQPVNYKWHMVHNEEYDSDYRKQTPPGGGMMYIDGYLRVENADGKDYIIIDESFYVNSCSSTPCDIEP